MYTLFRNPLVQLGQGQQPEWLEHIQWVVDPSHGLWADPEQRVSWLRLSVVGLAQFRGPRCSK